MKSVRLEKVKKTQPLKPGTWGWYCFGFRNPKANQPPFGCVFYIVNNGINYQAQLVFSPDFWTSSTVLPMNLGPFIATKKIKKPPGKVTPNGSLFRKGNGTLKISGKSKWRWNMTLPENHVAPENGGLEYDRFLLENPNFQGRTVSFWEYMIWPDCWCFFFLPNFHPRRLKMEPKTGFGLSNQVPNLPGSKRPGPIFSGVSPKCG